MDSLPRSCWNDPSVQRNLERYLCREWAFYSASCIFQWAWQYRTDEYRFELALAYAWYPNGHYVSPLQVWIAGMSGSMCVQTASHSHPLRWGLPFGGRTANDNDRGEPDLSNELYVEDHYHAERYWQVLSTLIENLFYPWIDLYWWYGHVLNRFSLIFYLLSCIIYPRY